MFKAFGRLFRRGHFRHALVPIDAHSAHKCPRCGGSGVVCDVGYPYGVHRCPRCGGAKWELN